MNNACCKPAASAVGVRAAALGSRGLLFNQRQCIFIMGTKGSPSPLSARSSLPHPYLPRATRPLESCNRQPSFFVVQCSGQEPAAYVLLKTTECADGSIMFNFGLSEQQSSNEAKEPPREDPWVSSGSNNGSTRIHKESLKHAQELKLADYKQKTEEYIINGASNNPDVIFNSAAAMIPHPSKVKTGGEDAFFIDGTRWVGVADGVPGINAGEFARELMENCAERARQVKASSDPKAVLIYAAKRTKPKALATTVIASLYDRTLRVANIGNSGFVLVRGSTVVASSKPMIRGINFPYLIGTEGDDPEMAEVFAVPVQKKDVVILGSDGIWDNLFEEQVIEIVNSVRRAGGEPGMVAHQLVIMASKASREREGMSPFAEAAHAAGYTDYLGGKLDDATAVVSYVT